MGRALTLETSHGSPYAQLLGPPPPREQMPPPSRGGLDGDISPSILLIIVILSVIFFISGLLHLLVRLLLRHGGRDPDDLDGATVLQGQLQQLFHLHDAGVDQSFIDALPVFLYRAIIGGLKDPFDCAVCLCEFAADDRLRLLPRCSHAFHIECIDTWLLSHSTCPLCRSSLLPADAFPAHGGCSPFVFVLESGSESSREILPDRALAAANCLGPDDQDRRSTPAGDNAQKAAEGGPKEEGAAEATEVVAVKLGKFRNVDSGSAAGDGEEGPSNNGNLDGRRCFSMGSFEYVMDEASVVHVAIKPQTRKGAAGAMKSRRRGAISECDCNSQREGFQGFEPPGSADSQPYRESFSVSRTWLRRPRKAEEEKGAADEEGGSRRAFSFRLPLQRGGRAPEEAKGWWCSSRRTADAEIDASSQCSFDVEARSCDGGGAPPRAEERAPSFARRTLLWIVGRHHKVVNHV